MGNDDSEVGVTIIHGPIKDPSVSINEEFPSPLTVI